MPFIEHCILKRMIAQKGDIDLAALICSHRAGRSLNLYGTTALLYAPAEGHVTVLQMLSDHRASFLRGTSTDETQLRLAAAHGHVATVSLLLECGPDGTVKRAKQAHLLHWRLVPFGVLLNEWLFCAGASFEVKDRSRGTPLMLYDTQTTSCLPLSPIKTFELTRLTDECLYSCEYSQPRSPLAVNKENQ